MNMTITPLNLIRAVAALALGVCVGAASAQTAPDIRFATIEQSRALLGTADEWSDLTTDFHRAATMEVAPPVDRERFLKFEADTAKPWTDAQRARWQKAIDAVKPRFVALGVPVPEQILLIKTDGRDSAGAPYTRRNAVMLPADSIDKTTKSGYSDVELLAHELFHVVSRHSPALSARLYETIGYKRVGLLQWPDAWKPARIVNPDAPLDRDAMDLTIDGRQVSVMPVIMASRTDLKPGESFFSVMDVRLLEVRSSNDGSSVAVMKGGEPVWHSLASTPEYFAKLGGNTKYVIHPEETMADNFAFLVSGRKVKNPALLERVDAVLKQPR
ncbi:hypothetical protein BH10PSE17_BH10PSE17_09720 [soil metagenome]